MNPWVKLAIAGIVAWVLAIASFMLTAVTGSSKAPLFISLGLSAIAGPLLLIGLIGYFVSRSKRDARA